MSKGEQTRRAIVDQALQLTRREGLEGTTLGVLASNLGLSKSGLFAHFRSKEALQVAVTERAIEALIEEVIAPALRSPRGEPRLRVLFERYLDWLRAHDGRCFFMALSQEYAERPGAVREVLVRSQRDWVDTITRIAGGALTEHHFAASVDPGLFAFEFLGILMAFQQNQKLLADPEAEGHARRAFEALLSRSRSTR